MPVAWGLCEYGVLCYYVDTQNRRCRRQYCAVCDGIHANSFISRHRKLFTEPTHTHTTWVVNVPVPCARCRQWPNGVCEPRRRGFEHRIWPICVLCSINIEFLVDDVIWWILKSQPNTFYSLRPEQIHTTTPVAELEIRLEKKNSNIDRNHEVHHNPWCKLITMKKRNWLNLSGEWRPITHAKKEHQQQQQ